MIWSRKGSLYTREDREVYRNDCVFDIWDTN